MRFRLCVLVTGKLGKKVICGRTSTKGYSQLANSMQRLDSTSLLQQNDWGSPETESTTTPYSQQQQTYSCQAMGYRYCTSQLHPWHHFQPPQRLPPAPQAWRLQSLFQSTKQQQSSLPLPMLPTALSAEASVQGCASKDKGWSNSSSNISSSNSSSNSNRKVEVLMLKMLQAKLRPTWILMAQLMLGATDA